MNAREFFINPADYGLPTRDELVAYRIWDNHFHGFAAKNPTTSTSETISSSNAWASSGPSPRRSAAHWTSPLLHILMTRKSSKFWSGIKTAFPAAHPSTPVFPTKVAPLRQLFGVGRLPNG